MNPKEENPSAEQNWATRLPRANQKKKHFQTWQKKIRQIYIFSTSQKTKAPHLNNLLIILTDLKIKVKYRIKIYVLGSVIPLNTKNTYPYEPH